MINIIDGKAIAQVLEEKIGLRISRIKEVAGILPTLAVILVEGDGASQIYVRNKKKKAESLGINSIDIFLDNDVTQKTLLNEIDKLNQNPEVHGILLQLPLPSQLDSFEAIKRIDPNKDVDGFHPENVGLLNIGHPRFVPCTPKGCVKLIKSVKDHLSGMNALIIGRSNVVGWPLSKLLLQENCTVTVSHSRTKNLSDHTKHADIIVVAAGTENLLTSEMITPHKSIIIDVGINRIVDEDSVAKIKGDVDFENLSKIACAITPVPGGVGPMTIACLMENMALACELLYKI